MTNLRIARGAAVRSRSRRPGRRRSGPGRARTSSASQPSSSQSNGLSGAVGRQPAAEIRQPAGPWSRNSVDAVRAATRRLSVTVTLAHAGPPPGSLSSRIARRHGVALVLLELAARSRCSARRRRPLRRAGRALPETLRPRRARRARGPQFRSPACQAGQREQDHGDPAGTGRLFPGNWFAQSRCGTTGAACRTSPRSGSTAPIARSAPPLASDLHADVCVIGAGITGLSAALELPAGARGSWCSRARFVGAGRDRLHDCEAELPARAHLRAAGAAARRGRRARIRTGQRARHRARLRAGRRARASTATCGASRTSPTRSRPDEREPDRGRGRGGAARRPAGVAGGGDGPALPGRRGGPLRRPGRVPPAEVPRTGSRARSRRPGAAVHEGTFAVGVDAGPPCRVRDRSRADGHRRAASSSPPTCRSSTAASTSRAATRSAPTWWPRRTTAGRRRRDVPQHRVAGPLDPDPPLGGRTWLLVGGESHKTGQGDARRALRSGSSAGRASASACEPVMRWATQDQMPADGVPYVGPVDPVSKNVYVATGFRKWGLAMGIALGRAAGRAGSTAATIRWRELFDTRRLRLRRAAVSLVKENANVALRFFGDRLVKRADVDSIEPGEGRIVGAGLGQRAVYRDEDGRAARAVGALHAPRAASSTGTPARGPGTAPATARASAPHGEVIMGPGGAARWSRASRRASASAAALHPALVLGDLAPALAHDAPRLALGLLGLARAPRARTRRSRSPPRGRPRRRSSASRASASARSASTSAGPAGLAGALAAAGPRRALRPPRPRRRFRRGGRLPGGLARAPSPWLGGARAWAAAASPPKLPSPTASRSRMKRPAASSSRASVVEGGGVQRRAHAVAQRRPRLAGLAGDRLGAVGERRGQRALLLHRLAQHRRVAARSAGPRGRRAAACRSRSARRSPPGAGAPPG